MKTIFCILAAGKGTRLSSLTNLHKALLPINNKAVISHIIDKAPNNAEIVIAIGYQKELIKEYCSAAHPDRKLVFVEIDNFDKAGSGPGYSLSKCKEYLQNPFYIFCADCLIEENIPNLENNWLGVYPVADPENWSTAEIINGNIINFKNKCLKGYPWAWIGVAGIKDYKVFWEQMKPGEDQEYEMVSAFYNPKAYPNLKAFEFTWHDTGTPQNYKKTKELLNNESPLGMSKQIDEVTYHCNDRCVKVFANDNIALDRIVRASILESVIPEMVFIGNHVYAYKWAKGTTFYEKCNTENLEKLLEWCKNKIWYNTDEIRKSIGWDIEFEDICFKFYYEKTIERFKKYLEKKGKIEDSPAIINGRLCDSVENYLAKIPWGELCKGIPVRFHGDLQPENIIITDDEEFKLIDWRDSFGGQINFGDMFYDLAKLYGGLSMSYHNIKQDKFEILINENDTKIVNYKFEVNEELRKMRELYENWILKNEFSLYKIRIITALIYLNMAPLHILPFDNLLFYHSKYLLSLLF